MDSLRKPLFVTAVVLISLVFLIEIGATSLLNRFATPPAATNQLPADLQAIYANAAQAQPAMIEQRKKLEQQPKPPGMGIPYLAMLDWLLLYSILLTGSGLVFPQSLQANLQGGITFVVSLFSVIAVVAAVYLALNSVIQMITLLLATPFGTIAYFILYGFFDLSGPGVILSLSMALKVAFIITLIASQQSFLQRNGLILLIVCSLVGNVVVSLLQGFPPGFLVSITDGIAAIILGIVAAILWLLVLLSSIPAILKVIGLVKLADH